MEDGINSSPEPLRNSAGYLTKQNKTEIKKTNKLGRSVLSTADKAVAGVLFIK